MFRDCDVFIDGILVWDVTQSKIASCSLLLGVQKCSFTKHPFNQDIFVPCWDIAMLQLIAEGHLGHSSANLKLNHLTVQVPPWCFSGRLKCLPGLHKCCSDVTFCQNLVLLSSSEGVLLRDSRLLFAIISHGTCFSCH